MIMAVLEGMRARVRWAMFKGLFLLSSKTVVNGLELIDVAEEDSERTLEGLRQALRLMERIDPRRYQRIKRDMRRIVLVKAGGPEFASEVGACLIRSRYVRESSPGAVATTLVHEGTHARLCRAGIGYGRQLRTRVEEVCVREQIDFAERLGDTEMLAHLSQKLQRPWWTAAQLHERRIAAWKELGVPGWAVRAYQRIALPGRSERRSGRANS